MKDILERIDTFTTLTEGATVSEGFDDYENDREHNAHHGDKRYLLVTKQNKGIFGSSTTYYFVDDYYKRAVSPIFKNEEALAAWMKSNNVEKDPDRAAADAYIYRSPDHRIPGQGYRRDIKKGDM